LVFFLSLYYLIWFHSIACALLCVSCNLILFGSAPC
jgi:hypothetical protein